MKHTSGRYRTAIEHPDQRTRPKEKTLWQTRQPHDNERIEARTSRVALNAASAQPPQSHTHVQQVADGQLVDQQGDLMALDRGMLAKVDRQVFAELGHDAATQAVKIPLSDAAWSTWRRYCQVFGLTMGEAVAGLIVHELQTAVGDHAGADAAVFAQRREEQLAVREAEVADRERKLAEADQRLSQWTERLGTWERALQARERRVMAPSEPASTPKAPRTRIGRNEPCPCGSGLKYKHCHGLTDRRA